MADTGIREINATFERLQKAAQLRVMRKSLNAALNPALKQLRANAPVGSKPHKTYKGNTVAPGFLKRKGIIKNTRIKRDKSGVAGNVRLKDTAWYGSLQEHGWRSGGRSKRVKQASRKGALTEARLKELGDNRKKIPGNKWWSSVIDRISEPTLKAYSDKIESSIMNEWNK